MGNAGNKLFNEASGYQSRLEALERRVAEAAGVLSDRGMRPTVARIRAALGGGSPNDLAPALKRWKESAPSSREQDENLGQRGIPTAIADLAVELWRRATVSAAIELKGGPQARKAAAQNAEAESLQVQVTQLRESLQRELIAFGELRAQAARQEALARDAVARLEHSEARERKQLRDLGTARQRVTELEASVAQLQANSSVRIARAPARSKPSRELAHAAKQPTRKKAVRKAAKRPTSAPKRKRGKPRAIRRPRR